jgi:hypothetical protein
LRLLCTDLLEENGVAIARIDARRRIRIVDGTIVRQPGMTGSQWRLLYSLTLPSLDCDLFEITGTEGAGAGESLQRVPAAVNDFILGDAGNWSTARRNRNTAAEPTCRFE